MFEQAEYIFDISGKRELVDETNIDFTIIKALIKIGGDRNLSKVSKIVLSSKSIMPNAARRLGNIIQRMDSLTHVDCSDIMSCINKFQALETFEILSGKLSGKKITHINLDQNALGSEGIVITQSLFSTATDISLCDVGISSESIKLLKTLTSTSIKSLQVFKNMIGDEGSFHMSTLLLQCPLIENLRWASVRARGKGLLKLAESLSSLKNLKILDLSDNTFGYAGGMALAESLRHTRSLEILNLSDISAGSSLGEILKSVSELPNLKILKLNDNEIEDDPDLTKTIELLSNSLVVEF